MTPLHKKAVSVVNVQYLRALAALIVAISHSAADVSRLHKTAIDFAIPGTFGVEIFFVISGFIICQAYLDRLGKGRKEVIRFLSGRFWRIVPFYWLCTTLYIAIAFFAGGFLNRNITSIAHILASYLFLPYPAPDGRIGPVYVLGWSLNLEVFFYALFAMAIFFRPKLALIGLTLIFLSLVALHSHFPEPSALSFWSSLYILEFLVGMWLSVLSRRVKWRGPAWAFWPMAFVILTVAAAVFHALKVPASGNGVKPFTIIFASALVASAIFLRTSRDFIGIFERIGNSSFSLYLLHMFVIRAGVLILAISGVYWSYLITMIGLIAASCVLSWYSFRFIENWFVAFGRHQRNTAS